MIGHRDLHTTASRPNFDMGTLYVRQGSAANIALLDVPHRCGITITRVWMRLTNCDGTQADYDAVKTGCTWIVDIPATTFATPGTVAEGVEVWASGVGADGETAAAWSIGVGDLVVRDGDSSAVAPSASWAMVRLYDGVTSPPKRGDGYVADGALHLYDGRAWATIGQGTVDPALSPTSTNPVQNKAIYDALAGKVDKEAGKGLSTNDYTTEDKTKLGGIAVGAQVNTIEGVSVNGTAVTPVNKIADIPVPSAPSPSDTTPAMDSGNGAAGSGTAYARGDHVHPSDSTKVDKVAGKGLSTNDYSDADKNKLAGIETGAQANVIEGVSFAGSAITPVNKVANVPATTATQALAAETPSASPVFDNTREIHLVLPEYPNDVQSIRISNPSHNTYIVIDLRDVTGEGVLATQGWSANTLVAKEGGMRTISASNQAGTQTAIYRLAPPGEWYSDGIVRMSDLHYPIVQLSLDPQTGYYKYLLSDRTINKLTTVDGTTLATLSFGFTYSPSLTRDLIIDVDNSANQSDLTLAWESYGEDFGLGLLNGADIATLNTVEAGTLARYYITSTSLTYNGTLPVYAIHRATVEVVPVEDSSSSGD